MSFPLLTSTGPRRWRDRAVRLAEAATTPLAPDDVLDLFWPLRPGAALRARVVAVRPETADAATVVLRPGADWAGHRAGQYLRIGVEVDGVRHWRSYSITSPEQDERTDGTISITVKAVDEGTVSAHLVRRAAPGDVVHLEQAAGEFVLGTPVPQRLLMLVAGSGVTPVMGMLRSLPADHQGEVTVIAVNTSSGDAIFGPELRRLADDGVITLHESHDDVHGLFALERLAELVPDLADHETYACGPGGLLDAVIAHFDDAGLADRLHTERFRVELVEAGEGGTVTFADGGEVEADGATAILDAAEDAGRLMPSGCRMGICYGCVLPMVSGQVRDLRTGEITSAVPGETEGDGVPIQTCISAAAGPCTLAH